MDEFESKDEFASLTRPDLIALVLEQRQTLIGQRQTIHALQQRVAELEQKLGPGGPPAFVKASVVRKQKAERKKRTQAFTRRRDEPTEVVYHAASCCPDCGRALSGGCEHRRRQVIDIPPVTVQVTDHVVMARWCGVCQKRVLPSLDLSAQVVGQQRVGVRLMSLIASLKTVSRLPVRQITTLLRDLYGLHLSCGEVCRLLDTVAARGQTTYQHLQSQVRGSPFVHGDETGWREDGQNGYLWSFSTPTVRFFHHNLSRAGTVPVEVLGADFGGVCVSDFYGGYNSVGTVRQRCWVHFLRDLHTLTQKHADDVQVQTWAGQVRGVYDAARDFQRKAREALTRHGKEVGNFGFGMFDCQRKRKELEERLYALAKPWLPAQCPEARPQTVLSKRVESFLSELFVFVERPEVPSENNAAERSVRPAVIARKVSGGTRSSKGSSTKSVLLSLFGTWQVQGRDTLEACRQMLISSASNTASTPAT